MLVERFLELDKDFVLGLEWHVFYKSSATQRTIFLGANKNKPSAFIKLSDGVWQFGLTEEEGVVGKYSLAASFSNALVMDGEDGEEPKVAVAIERVGVGDAGDDLYWLCAVQNHSILINTDAVVPYDQVMEVLAEIQALIPEGQIEYWGSSVSEFIFDNFGNPVAGKKIAELLGNAKKLVRISPLKDPRTKSYAIGASGLAATLALVLTVVLWPEPKKSATETFTPTQEMIDQVTYESEIVPPIKASMDKLKKGWSAKGFVQMIDTLGVLKISPWHNGWKVENIACNAEGCRVTWLNQGEGSVVDLKEFYKGFCDVEDGMNNQASCAVAVSDHHEKINPVPFSLVADLDKVKDEFNKLEQVIKDFGASVSQPKPDPVPPDYPRFKDRASGDALYFLDEGRWNMAGSVSEFMMVINRLRNEDSLGLNQMNLNMISSNFNVSGAYYVRQK